MTDKMSAEELAIQFWIVRIRTSEVHATRLAASIKIRDHIEALQAENECLKATGVDLVCRLVDAEAEAKGLREALETIKDQFVVALVVTGRTGESAREFVEGIARQALAQTTPPNDPLIPIKGGSDE